MGNFRNTIDEVTPVQKLGSGILVWARTDGIFSGMTSKNLRIQTQKNRREERNNLSRMKSSL